MKKIPLTQGLFAIVDDDMYDEAARKYHGEFAYCNFDEPNTKE